MQKIEGSEVFANVEVIKNNVQLLLVSTRGKRLKAIAAAHDVVLDETVLLKERLKLLAAEKAALELAYSLVDGEGGEGDEAFVASEVQDRRKNFIPLHELRCS